MTTQSVVVVSFQSLTQKSGAGMAKFGYYISQALHRERLLQHFVVHSKGKFTTPFPSVPVSPWSRYYLRLLSAFAPKVHMPNHKQRLLQEKLFDLFCADRVTSTTRVLIATQPFLEKTFAKAKKLGATTVFIPGTAEENFIHDIVVSERERTNIGGEDAYTDPARLAFYNRSMRHLDIVAAPFSAVYESYQKSTFNGRLLELYGYLKPEIQTGNPKRDSGIFKVGYLAHTVLLKGLIDLLDAWLLLERRGALLPHMQLHIAGGMDEDMQRYIDSHYRTLKQVFFTGHTQDVSAFYQSLDLFVVPSLTDGTPYTAIEAAMNGVPVLLTENCGSKTFLSGEKGVGCFVIPIRDPNAIAHHISEAIKNPEKYVEVGLRGKQYVADYNSEGYIKQVVAFTKELLPNKA